MSDTTPGPIPEDLAKLLTDWINTDTWNESQEILKTNAERLLSDEAFEALNELLSENAEDEATTKTLLQHKTILETARAESIDAAYAELLKSSRLELPLQTLPDELREALQAMITVSSPAELLEQIKQYPILLTEQASAAIDTLLDDLRQAGQEAVVAYIEQRYETLKQVIEGERDPLNIALNALLQADTPRELQQAIAEHPTLLDDETINGLTAMAAKVEQDGNIVVAQVLRHRLSEVQRIRQQREHISRNGNTNTVNPDVYEREQTEISADRNSIAVGSITGDITQTNIESYTLPAKHWQPPKRQSLPKTFVGRQKKLQELRDYLIAGEGVAISGTTTATLLQGMGGIGKTYLAIKLSMELQAHFPGGVISIDLGPLVTNEERAQVQLRKLASYAFEGNQPQLVGQLQPEQVAAWLEETAPGRLLVIFDDVWYREPLLFLERALPIDAVRIVTTRDANITQALGGKKISLDRLTVEDGLALLEDRLGCQGNATYRPALEKLVELLGGHALALDIAASRIKNSRRIQSILDDLQKGIGRGKLDGLKLPRGDARDTNLEKSLALSYEQMTDEEQNRFRTLGVFAAETPITVEAAAAIWSLDNLNAAKNALFELTDLSLLNEFEDAVGIIYRQHSLLHTYGYALLEKTGELNSASWAHAEFYRAMAVSAETNSPKDYPLLDQHMQNLQAALQWTDKHEPVLFSQLVEVLFQFLQLRGQSELLEIYLPKAAASATATGNKGRQANLLRSLGDLESRLGNLDQARSHYDAALPLYRSERARLGEANLLKSLGDLESRLGNLDQARSHYDAALPLYRSERARLGEANVYMSLGDMSLAQKDWTGAKTYYEQALPLYVAERDPLGQANTLIDLGRSCFELGDHEQGMQEVQQAAVLFRSVQDEQWARRAEQYLAEMRTRLEHPKTVNESSSSDETELLEAFINVESQQAMFELVQQNPQLLTDTWFTMLEELIAAQADEGAKQYLSELFATLKQIGHDIGQQTSASSAVIRVLDEFARADWAKRRQLLDEQGNVLLSEQVEPVFDMLVQAAGTDTDTIQILEQLRTLLRHCRMWSIDPVWYFELGMRLGDSIDIPAEYEPAVMNIAALLSRQREDSTVLEQGVKAMQELLGKLSADAPPLFRAALLRDLADTMGALPADHPLRNLEQMKAYYREALPFYQAAGRPLSVAYIQRSIGDILTDQGRYEEALERLQSAAQGLQVHEENKVDAAWALSAYGSALNNLGKVEEALAAYAEAMTLLPDSAPLLRNRAETLIHVRRLEEAEADMARAVELDGNEDSPYLWYRRAQLAIARGDAVQSDQMLNEVTKRDPSFDVALVPAQSAWLRGDLGVAQEELHKVLEKANAGDRVALRRDMQLLFDEHPELAGRDELRALLMKD